MASSAIKTEEEKKEYFDTPEDVDKMVTELAELIKASKHFIVFTGAGISTSTGIPDFRSGYNTVLKTGPGAWEKAAQKAKVAKPTTKVDMSKAIPSPTHMAFVKLMSEGYLKFLISQNVDGLHRRSGINPAQLAEVHGNTNVEKCTKCGMEYLRDFRVREAQNVHDHKTSRFCDNPKCKGQLIDSIINFGDNLPKRELEEGFAHGKKADVCLAMGSSLRVTPAANMPEETADNGGKLFIVNLQKTPLDSKAYKSIHAMCDDVIILLMKKLGLEIPKFKLTRRINIADIGSGKLLVKGVDSNGSHYSLFKSVGIEFDCKAPPIMFTKEPYGFALPKDAKLLKIKLEFQKHYSEPNLTIEVPLAGLKSVTYVMMYDFEKKAWDTPISI
jgi:NAD-dependent SIR2 family protein deacetylase